ncbi:MAG: PTS sugar transporter subunit IIA [Tissierellia bacterium]|nr:PTS sugar transporter subunit IIA [Tissierellia bacterium]
MYSLKDIGLKDIKLNIEADNWEDAIRKLAIVPLERKLINQNYVEAMVNSVKEFGPYIVLGPHIALAHARPEDGALETALYFTSLKDSIEFGSEDFDPVKILILLSAKDSDSHINLLSDLSVILGDDEAVEKLMNASSEQEFLNTLKGALDEN